MLRSGLVIVLCLAGPVGWAQTVNLILNGSFENPSIFPWSEISHSLFGEDFVCDSSCPSGYMASDGDRYVLIAGGTFTGNTTGIVRSRPLFVPTHASVLQFDWSTLGSGPDGDPCAGEDDGIAVYVDDTQVWSNLDGGPCVNVIPYATVTVDLIALGFNDGDYHTIEFRGSATGIPPSVDLSNVYLDNVRLIAESFPDTDGDGVDDSQDNCVLHANAAQCDGDGDGIGNRCDADFNNDCIVNAVDLGILRSIYFTPNPIGDLNCDGIVNVSAAVDLGLFKTLFHQPPGPSALPNACQDPKPQH